MRSSLIFLISFFLFLHLKGQHTNFFLNKSYFNNFEQEIHFSKENFHTSFKPIIKSDILTKNSSLFLEALYNSDFLNIENTNYFKRKLFTEHLFILKDKNYQVLVSPLIDFNIGRELMEEKELYTNTRGYIIEGDLGKKFSFFSSFLENQSVFSNYLDDYINENRVVPGQGRTRVFKEKGFDYAMSSGYVSLRQAKTFVVQFGHGKHFIGDGYRSLLLSDNSFNYPYLRVQTTFWKIQYTNLYAELQDINYFNNNGFNNYDQMGFLKKYMSSHYLSINTSSRFNISLFESVIWRTNHAPGVTGFDINYLNPIALLRPIEFSINSPDNVLVGLNTKYNFLNNSYLYAQIILDEFSLNYLRENHDYWGNKYGYQLGYKIFDFFSISDFSLQIEYNYVRPYTYAHHNPQQNYAHYNQPLSHPLGANFSELLFLSSYKFKRIALETKIIHAKYGGKKLNDPTSYGNDLYMSTGNFAETEGLQNIGEGRPSDFGIEMYQGNFSDLLYASMDIAYIFNPQINFKANLGFAVRQFKDEYIENKTFLVNFGVKTDLFNHYYDF